MYHHISSDEHAEDILNGRNVQEISFFIIPLPEILLEELEEALKEERLERGIVLFISHSTWSMGRHPDTFIKNFLDVQLYAY